jgi:hypothetical protein
VYKQRPAKRKKKLNKEVNCAQNVKEKMKMFKVIFCCCIVFLSRHPQLEKNSPKMIDNTSSKKQQPNAPRKEFVYTGKILSMNIK